MDHMISVRTVQWARDQPAYEDRYIADLLSRSDSHRSRYNSARVQCGMAKRNDYYLHGGFRTIAMTLPQMVNR